MEFSPPLAQGTLIRRYKRFLADICLADGTIITAHCPNTGAMRGCSSAGSPVAFSYSANPARKYPHTLEMVREHGVWVGVNTARTNTIVSEAILQGRIARWQDVTHIQAEVRISAGTRLDLRLIHADGTTTMVEIKSCSLAEDGVALFPDAVTVRGAKHLQELANLAAAAEKSAIFYLVQRQDASVFRVAEEIDARYAECFVAALKRGVQVVVCQARISPAGIEVIRELPVAGKYASILQDGTL